MALTQATSALTKDLNPTSTLTAAAVSDGLDAALNPPPATATAQAVAVVEPNATPTTQAALYTQPHAVAEVDAFSKLDDLVNFTSFPTAKIDQGSILLDGVKVASGSLTVLITNVEFQWIVKSSSAQDAKYYFSPDGGLHDSKKNLGADIKRQWLATGAKESEFNTKQYAVIHAINKETETMIAMSIAPTSLGRLGGYKAELKALRQLSLDQCWTIASLGPIQKAKVGEASVSWTPWNFKFGGPIVTDVVEPK